MFKKPFPKALAGVLLVIIVLCSLYFFVFEKVVFFSDLSWNNVFPKKELFTLHVKLLTKGKRLTVKTVGSVNQIENAAKSAKIIIFSPVLSSGIAKEGRNLSSLEAITIGMLPEGSSDCFDYVLLDNEASGWREAAEYLSKSNTLDVALIFNETAQANANAFKLSFGETGIREFEQNNESGELFFLNVISEIKQKDILFAVCPYVKEFSEFFRTDATIPWVVDYRYWRAVPKDQLLGFVFPKLSDAVMTVLDNSEANKYLELDFAYQKR